MINRRTILKSIPLVFFPAKLFADDLPDDVFGLAHTFIEILLDDTNFQHSRIECNHAFYMKNCRYVSHTKEGKLLKDEIRPTIMCDYITPHNRLLKLNESIKVETIVIPLYKQDPDSIEEDMQRMIKFHGDTGKRFIVKYKDLCGLIIFPDEDTV